MARSVPIVQSQAGSQGAKSIAVIPSTTTILRQSATAVNLSKPLAKVLQLQPQDLRSSKNSVYYFVNSNGKGTLHFHILAPLRRGHYRSSAYFIELRYSLRNSESRGLRQVR